VNDNQALQDYASDMEDCQREAERDEAYKAQFMESLRGMVSSADFARIELELGESGWTWGFEIVDTPEGSEQHGGFFEHGNYFVNQTSAGGYTGNEHTGTVSIPVAPCKWFKFSYSM
jgi:hypothetical protein